MRKAIVITILALLLIPSVFAENLDDRNLTFAAYKTTSGSSSSGDTGDVSITVTPSIQRETDIIWTFASIDNYVGTTMPFFTWTLTGNAARVIFSVSGPLVNSYNNSKKVDYTLSFTTGSTVLTPQNSGNNYHLFSKNGNNYNPLQSISLNAQNQDSATVYYARSQNDSKYRVTYTNSTSWNSAATINTASQALTTTMDCSLSANPDPLSVQIYYYYTTNVDPLSSDVLSSVSRTGTCTILIDEESFESNRFPGRFGAVLTVTLEAL